MSVECGEASAFPSDCSTSRVVATSKDSVLLLFLCLVPNLCRVANFFAGLRIFGADILANDLQLGFPREAAECISLVPGRQAAGLLLEWT